MTDKDQKVNNHILALMREAAQDEQLSKMDRSTLLLLLRYPEAHTEQELKKYYEEQENNVAGLGIGLKASIAHLQAEGYIREVYFDGEVKYMLDIANAHLSYL